MTKKNASVKVPVITLIAIVALGVGFFGYKARNHKASLAEAREVQPQTVVKKDDSTVTVPAADNPTTNKEASKPTVVEEPKQTIATLWPMEISEGDAVSLQVVVNKKHKLPEDYVPSLISVAGGKMRPEAASAFEDMLTQAKNDGVGLRIVSSYRSYSQQVSVYNGYVAQYGVEQADTFSARPGHSEHQTGLAVDVGANDGSCELEICFETTPAGMWVKNNSYKFGFVVRYPKGKEDLTGYQYEPWHLRYVGSDVASKMHSSGQTLDDFYSVEAGGY